MASLYQKSNGAEPIVLGPEDAAHAARLLSLIVRPNAQPIFPETMHSDERAILAKEIHEARRARDKFFPSEIFADPAWDILLILYWGQYQQRRLTITSVCAAAAVPPTTALRWIENLRRVGLVRKIPNPTDARVQWLELSPDAAEKLNRYFDTMLDDRAFAHIKRETAA